MSSFSLKNNKLKILCYRLTLVYFTLLGLIVFLISKFLLTIHRRDILDELNKNLFLLITAFIFPFIFHIIKCHHL